MSGLRRTRRVSRPMLRARPNGSFPTRPNRDRVRKTASDRTQAVTYRSSPALLVLFLATACTPSGDALNRLAEPALITSAEAPADVRKQANPDACWSKTTSPAVIETITERLLVQPAQISSAGTITQPPIYRTRTRQRIVDDGNRWFEIPCALRDEPVFIATLQRALAARDFYGGPVTSAYDARTRAAVRAYQRPEGPDSGVLSLRAARALGLVAVPRDKTR